MSHRAVVAAANAEDTSRGVTLYHSQNGADQLRLFTVLNELLRHNPTAEVSRVNDIPNDIETEVDTLLSTAGSNVVDAPEIDPEPITANLQPDAFVDQIDFVQYEATYGVHLPAASQSAAEHPVDIFLPVFIDVGIMLFFMRFIEFEAYPRSQLSDEFEEVTHRIIERSLTPEFTLSQGDYLEVADHPEQLELLIDTHMGLFQTLYSVSETPEQDELATMVVSGDYYVVARVDLSSEIPLPDPHGTGVLVQLPVAELQFSQLVSLYQDWRYLTERLRITHALDALDGFMAAIESGDPSSYTVDTYETALLKDLGEEFESSISALSPDSLLTRM